MLKKILSVVMVLVLVMGVGVALTGCGGGGGNNLNGTWEHLSGLASITFSGRNFVANEGHMTTQFLRRGGGVHNGTFSITGDQIEFVFENGEILVQSFSRTENTIQIHGWRFYRQ